MSEDLLAGQQMVDCAVCEESVPFGHTMLRPSLGRICWFCYTDENVDPDRSWRNDEDDDDDDDDDYDDDDDEWDEDDEDWYDD